MFKLQRLEITGFKSFADHTEIVFTGSGITAVVGPNGCGKSNVSDCISWVLGEQRAKSLRGGEMKDVIFQGSKNRKPGGMAEVILHMVRDTEIYDIQEKELEDIDQAIGELDENAIDVDAFEAADETAPLDAASDESGAAGESEKALAVQVGSVQTAERTVRTKRHWRPRAIGLDFAPGEAVSITRRLYLSGESEYQINGKHCRLRDIQDLFAGTGLSGGHYAIIEQGRIGQILSAKPSDRRSLIEEAAGISKFRIRQRAAETRLDSAKNNLSRITDIVSEIDKQAASLRRQAAKTRRFVVLQEEFRTLLRKVFAAEGQFLTGRIGELERQLAEIGEREAALVAQVGELEESTKNATSAARLAEEELADVRRRHADNALERDRTERELRYRREQAANLLARRDAVGGELEAYSRRLQLAESEIERLRVDDEREGTEADASRMILAEAEQRYAKKLEELREIERRLDSERSELMRHIAAAERFDEIERQLRLNAERMEENLKGLEREANRAAEALSTHTADGEKMAVELEAENAKVEALQHERKELSDLTAAARMKVQEAEAEHNGIQQELSRNTHRFETLQELENRRAVYAPQIQKLFAEKEKIGVKAKGVLADFLSVDEATERLVENVFGPYLQAVVVERVEDAKAIAAWLETADAGRMAVLVAPDAVKGGKHDVGRGDLGGLLGADAQFLKVLERAFGRELNARTVDDIVSDGGSGSDSLVDRQGNIRLGDGLYIFGRHQAEGKGQSVLAFKRELSVLEKNVARLSKDAGRSAEKVEKERAALAELEEKTVDLQSVLIKVERHILGLEAQANAIKLDIERSQRHKEVVAAEIQQLTAERTEIKDRIEAAVAGRNAAREAMLERERAVKDISAELAAARERSDAENAVLNEKRTQAATSGERRRSVQSALRRVENEKKEIEMRIASLEREAAEAGDKIKELNAAADEMASKVNAAPQAIEAEAAELEKAQTAVQQGREGSDAASSRLAEANRKLAETLNERAAVDVSHAETVTQLRNVNENCQQELNTPLAELIAAEDLSDDIDLPAERSNVDDLRRRLDAFGAINMLAVEELAETEERLTFLTSQRQDIIDSIESAQEALREIKERSRAKFKEAFEAVNANFVEFFHELFGGGRGEMTLLEADDILDAGIEIAAQPPGKRLQNILLLSGGEKAMTAIALILAIFKYRPSPFCLLDEVDAPLDEANVGRFVTKISEMSEKTQFIVITHNKRTMEAARALYGVTMQEAGVSKVVSVKFE